MPRLAVLAAVCVMAFVLCGCKTDERPESAKFASVEIRGHNPQEIRATTADVFRENGFTPKSGNLSTIVFERQGSTMNNIAYGNWMGGGIASRATVNFIPVTGDLFRIECHAFLVRNSGEVLEEEVRIKSIHSGTYQKMLKEVAKRLGQKS